MRALWDKEQIHVLESESFLSLQLNGWILRIIENREMVFKHENCTSIESETKIVPSTFVVGTSQN